MNSSFKILRLVLAILALQLFGQSDVCARVAVEQLRCEYLENPLGIDAMEPRLSWILSSDARGEKQTAYELLVASEEKKLARGEGDLWSSGKVDSDKSIHVRYAGKPLETHQECFWKVRIWDKDGKASAWSKPAKWSMGLLKASDWKGQWIGKDGVETKPKLEGTSWIWFPDPGNPADKAPVGKRWLRKNVKLSSDRTIKSAELLVTGDNHFVAFVNGEKIGDGGNFKAANAFDVTKYLRSGNNALAIVANNTGDAPNPGGAIALLKIEFTSDEPLLIPTDETWKAHDQEISGWEKANFDDASWKAAKKLGAVGMGPWGEVGAPEDRRLPARYLRKEFLADQRIRRATAYISGLGLSELYLNGKKISDHVLSPGLTEYNKRAFYVTHDVTSEVKRGQNAIGVILGNGRFYAPRLTVPTHTQTYGFPKLLFQLRLDYADGSSETIVSDSTWKITDNGPIRANSEYDGEEYDARLEMDGWSKPDFDDGKWSWAQLVKSPSKTLSAPMQEPIRVTQTLKPVSMKEVKPGVYVYDMGQNMVGWCRLKVSGPAETQVSLRHAEILKPNGEIYLDNIRSAKVTATYTLHGNGSENYEPRFTYFGFRYVELTGFPGKPSLSTLEGKVVHDDLPSAGEFSCSNPLLNQIYQNVKWGLRGNYRSLPTDCPQRDERQAWLGDRAFEAKGETYFFNTAALYAKWLRDIADGQKENGSISDVSPTYWPLFNDNVAWPSASIVMPAMLHEQFADEGIIARHYPSMKKWMDHMITFMKDGLIAKDSYGDWCVPPEEQSLIHSKDPKRQTNKELLSSAYFYNNCKLMARYATMLKKLDDAERFNSLAQNIKSSFNAKFLKKDLGQYDNGTQTSCVLPLAFGLVPDDQRERIVARLVKAVADNDGHIATGLVGGQWLQRVLSDNGRADLSYAMAKKTNYPSWGYMIGKGATTIWELWNGDTADPAMNSGNHLMLVGDLAIWMHEYLAGIKADPEQPGFKHIIMKPHPVGDLKSARASHRSPYGLISSDWKKSPGTFSWNITIPANTTATLYVPGMTQHFLLEGGKPVSNNPGLRFLRVEKGWEVFAAEAGSYRLERKHVDP